MLRLLALLIALGLCAGVASAGDPVSVAPGAVALAALVDEAQDASEIEVIVTPAAHDDEDRTIDAPASLMHPPRYQHLLFVFRPPRVPAFN